MISGISKATKNALWVAVTENFNARAQFRREQSILEKKWENLQRDHRNLYMDFQREISLTGTLDIKLIVYHFKHLSE
jgi:hypothetical protein